MYESRWLKFLNSGFVLSAVLLTLIGCIKQESVQSTQDQKGEREETTTGSVSDESDSTSAMK